MFQTRLEAQDRERQREWDWRESERKSAERAQRMSAIMGLCMTLPLLMMGMNNRCSTNSSLHQTYYPQEQYVSYQDQGYYSQDYVPFVQANSGSDYNDGYIIKDSAVFKDGYQYKDSGNYRDDFVYQDGGLIDTNQSNVASLGLLGI